MAKGIIRRGTAAEAAEHFEGFSPNGEGMWTRTAASAAGNTKSASYVDDPKLWGNGKSRLRGPRSKTALIEENKRALTKLRQRAGRENVPALVIRLKRQIEIKLAFITKLESERQ